jgi:hypothetical protein
MSYISNLKLEMKKMLILIKFKYSYFKIISNYTKYNFQNGLWYVEVKYLIVLPPHNKPYR